MQLKRIIRIIATILTISTAICSFSACQKAENLNNATDSSENDSVYLSFEDSLGNNVVLTEKPVRIAILFSSLADIWVCAGGNVDITVGETVQRGFASDDAVLVDGGAGKAIDTELLIASEPDLVICSPDIAAQAECAELLSKAGIPCAAFRVDGFEDYLKTLRIMCDITGDETAYYEYGEAVKTRVEQTIADYLEGSDSVEAAKILFIRCGSSAGSTKAKTASDNFVCEMLNELGTYNIAEAAPVLLDGLSIEKIIEADPDFIFFSTMGDRDAAVEYMTSVLEEPAWQTLTAIRENRYAFLPKELFQFKPNARWDEAYQYLTGLLSK